jgi:murein DD-endopeptidase MepM/ murein hydrolase activator NlpD
VNRVVYLYVLCFLKTIVFSQQTIAFAWPIDTPRVITGNYGELRPNHFHMGWDFSTGGKVNFPVYAIADGYVSRIKVSASGYGKALYITHPQNKLSLYAHLFSFAGVINEHVKNVQVSKFSFEIESFPAVNELPVKKGQLIGYSGNTGASQGPHLHFEIRDQKTEGPLNLFEFYKLNDTVPPELTHLAFYDLADTICPKFLKSFKLKKNKNDSLFLIDDSLILNSATLGLAFSGLDRFVRLGNPNVIYKSQVLFDNEIIFSYRLNHLLFNEQRYVNEFTQTVDKIKYQKCFLPTLFPAAIYEQSVNKGRIFLADTFFHQIKIILQDENDNRRTISFFIKTKKLSSYTKPKIKTAFYVDCNKDVHINTQQVQLFIPAKTFYYSTELTIINKLTTDFSLSIKPQALNMAAPATINIKPPNQLISKLKQIVLQHGAVVYAPQIHQDSLSYSVFNLGDFKLLADTIAPKIKTQLTKKQIKRARNLKTFAFTLLDNLSGVKDYDVYVNNNWVLAEYDAKSHLLTYTFDDDTPTGDLSFKVEAEDKVGNKKTFNYLLKR